ELHRDLLEALGQPAHGIVETRDALGEHISSPFERLARARWRNRVDGIRNYLGRRPELLDINDCVADAHWYKLTLVKRGLTAGRDADADVTHRISSDAERRRICLIQEGLSFAPRPCQPRP